MALNFNQWGTKTEVPAMGMQTKDGLEKMGTKEKCLKSGPGLAEEECKEGPGEHRPSNPITKPSDASPAIPSLHPCASRMNPLRRRRPCMTSVMYLTGHGASTASEDAEWRAHIAPTNKEMKTQRHW